MLVLAVHVDKGVSQDSKHPGVQIGTLPERVERYVCLHHGFLHEILSVLVILAQAACVAVELVAYRDDIALRRAQFRTE